MYAHAELSIATAIVEALEVILITTSQIYEAMRVPQKNAGISQNQPDRAQHCGEMRNRGADFSLPARKSRPNVQVGVAEMQIGAPQQAVEGGPTLDGDRGDVPMSGERLFKAVP
jgi:hypothetical protein